MPEPGGAHGATFEYSLLISSAPTRVLGAFFDPEALAQWWQAARSVTTPRPLGVYAVEWNPTPAPDEILGRLGGVFHGTVMEYLHGREAFIADAWWMPPDGEPLGPMSLEIACTMDGPACRLRVCQAGFEEGERWQRYFSVIERGWISALAALQEYIETLSCG
jgi:uncharacterized protein YndB with AHSA1/START domain